MLGPADERVHVDPEASGHLFLRKHAPISETIIARTEFVLVDEVGDAMRGCYVARPEAVKSMARCTAVGRS